MTTIETDPLVETIMDVLGEEAWLGVDEIDNLTASGYSDSKIRTVLNTLVDEGLLESTTDPTVRPDVTPSRGTPRKYYRKPPEDEAQKPPEDEAQAQDMLPVPHSNGSGPALPPLTVLSFELWDKDYARIRVDDLLATVMETDPGEIGTRFEIHFRVGDGDR